MINKIPELYTKIVIATHQMNDKKYAWYIPHGFSEELKKGDIILVDTKKGQQFAKVVEIKFVSFFGNNPERAVIDVIWQESGRNGGIARKFILEGKIKW